MEKFKELEDIKPIIDSTKEYFEKFPELNEFAKLNIEYLDSEPTNYSLDEVPGYDPIVEEYIDGSSLRQFRFIFASREFFGTDENKQKIQNSGFYEKISRRLEHGTENDILPNLEGNRKAISVEAKSSGYVHSVASGLKNARYQIQCVLMYEQDVV